MAKKYRKYNWEKLKIKYFKSDELSVRNFLESNYPSVNGHMLKMTTGWYKEKKDYEMEKEKKLLKRHVRKEANKEARKVAGQAKERLLKELNII